MTQQQIHYVLTLAQERSFSKAAKVLFVSQPSLSQYIKNIEQQLGAEIFDRSTSPLTITPAGEAFLRAAEKIKCANDELHSEIADLNELKTGNLTIGTSSFCASCLLPQSLALFHKTYPGVSIHIITESLANLTPQLLAGNVDCIIDTCNMADDKIIENILFTERYYLAVEKGHPFCQTFHDSILSAEDIMNESAHLYEAPNIDISCLANETLLLPNQSQSLYAICHKILEHGKTSPGSIFYTDHMETSFYWTLAGLGVSFLPDTLIRFGNYSEHPLYFPLDPKISEHNIVVAFRKNRYVSTAAKTYLQTLKMLIGQGTWLNAAPSDEFAFTGI